MAVRAFDPRLVGTRYLATVNAAKFTQLHEACGLGAPRPGEVGPSAFRLQPFAMNATKRRRLARRQRRNANHLDRPRRRSDDELRDDRGRHRIGKRCSRWLYDLQPAKSEIPQKQVPDQAAVIHVQPLGRGDYRANVTRRGVERRREKEICVQAGKLAGGDPSFGRVANKPGLPLWLDQVMAHVRRIADVQRAAPHLLHVCAAIVCEEHGGSFRQPCRCQVTTA